MQDRTGALPHQLLHKILEAGYIRNASPDCVLASSLVLQATDHIYRMPGSYLPKPDERIADIVAHNALFRHDISQPLDVGGTYLVRLTESLALPGGLHATAHGVTPFQLMNIHTRVLADRNAHADEIPSGYTGTLWVEIRPRSFPVLLHLGMHISQMQFFHGNAALSRLEHRIAHDTHSILRFEEGAAAASSDSQQMLTLHASFSPDIIGWRARDLVAIFDPARDTLRLADFFDPVPKPRNGELLLRDNSFYLLKTQERVVIPPTLYAHVTGEHVQRTALSPTHDRHLVLGCQPHDGDTMLRDGQELGTIHLGRMLQKPLQVPHIPSLIDTWFPPPQAQVARQEEMR